MVHSYGKQSRITEAGSESGKKFTGFRRPRWRKQKLEAKAAKNSPLLDTKLARAVWAS